MWTVIALVALLFFSPPSDKPDCREVERITGGVELAWLGYEQGGWDLPSDLKRTARVDFAVGGIWVYEAASEPDVKYMWWFGDYVADGEPRGLHNFCAVRVAADG